jgi:hypothetical protein
MLKIHHPRPFVSTLALPSNSLSPIALANGAIAKEARLRKTNMVCAEDSISALFVAESHKGMYRESATMLPAPTRTQLLKHVENKRSDCASQHYARTLATSTHM